MKADVNGIALNYELFGPEDGPVVALSHSLACAITMWAPQLAVLCERYRVLAFDTRGHGASEAPAGPYSLDQLGDDAVGLLDALDLPAVHWVGLSMGGMIGQNLALRTPDRILSLTLCDTTSAIPDAAQASWDERIAAAEGEGMTALVDSTMQRWFTAAALAADPPGLAAIRQLIADTPPAGFAGCAGAIRRLNYTARLGEITAPTRVIVGEEDPGTPVAASEVLRDGIPGADLVVIAQASHLSNVEQPEAFNEAMLDFLDRQAG